MDKERLRQLVYSIFSDITMIFLALLVIPVVAAGFLQLTPAQDLIVSILDWTIYFFFFFEFVLKTYLDGSKYIKTHKLDSVISLIIIFSPILDLISSYFVSAPALRLLRLSRLVRLVAVGTKARRSWRHVNLKSYAIVAVVVLVGVALSFFRISVSYSANDIAIFATFIQLVGVLYAIITGFVMWNVWGKYNSLDSAIRKETLALENIYLMGLQLKQKKPSQDLKKNIVDYVEKVVDIYWKSRGKIAETDDDFARFFGAVERFHAKNKSEQSVLQNMNTELLDASSRRSEIASLVSTKTSVVLWALLIVLATTLILSFLVASFVNQLFATVALTLLSTAIAVITVIIYDMDYPFQAGFWVISPEAYFELEDFIKTH